MRKKFFTKKATLIVLASMIGSSIVAAGCGATNTEEDKPTTTAYEEASTYSETDVQQTESQSAESSVVMGDNSEEEPIMQDGKYIYTIGDGSVTLALKTNIYDYLEPVPDYKNGQYKRFAMEKLAPELGWTSQYGSEMDTTYYAECDGKEIHIETGGYYNPRQEGISGKTLSNYVSVTSAVRKSHSMTFFQYTPDKAFYLHGSKKRSLTLDLIVITTFILEHKDELHNDESLDSYFSNWRNHDAQYTEYVIP